MRNPIRGTGVAGQLHALLDEGASGPLSDAELLGRFATRRSEAAFAALVERHGPMVLRACRSILGDPHRAEDAFQVTFLLLAGRAGSLWVRDSIGPWLHSVACRAASGARAAERRRIARERRAASLAPRATADDPGRDDLGPALHEEVERLPARLRAAVVLCYLEGLTHDQAAEHLACPVGTVRSRLARGRDRLRRGLARRGFAPPPSASPDPGTLAPPEVPAPLAALAIRAARLTPGRPKLGPLAPWLTRFSEGVFQPMMIHPLKSAAVLLLASGALAAGLGLPPGQEPKPAKDPAPAPSPRDVEVANRPQSKTNLRVISLAMHNYYSAHDAFPPAVLTGPDGKTPHSWRVAILPYMGEKELYQQYKLDEPWDGPNNRKLIEKLPAAFRAFGDEAPSTDASYFALTGPGAVFSGKLGTKFDAILDGVSDTILIVESKKPIPWTKPEDIAFTADDPLPGLGGYNDLSAGKGAFHAALVDGGVRLIPGTTKEATLRALISKAGNDDATLP